MKKKLKKTATTKKTELEGSSAFFVAAMIFVVNRYDMKNTLIIIDKLSSFVKALPRKHDIFTRTYSLLKDKIKGITLSIGSLSYTIEDTKERGW
ncbi:hypothetical protein [Halobacillus sp. B23F22_1]|uniref:hypothetical protein n=1 Tax=Halobacillus sp. B23F22_1 TaxID=3459514 RepID=UPI00373F3DB7